MVVALGIVAPKSSSSPNGSADFRLDFSISDLQLDAHALPRALCAHIVAEEQLNAKIGHGNAQDQIHATYVIDADLLATADGAFFDALRALPAVVPRAAPAAFVNRAAPSIVEQLDEIA